MVDANTPIQPPRPHLCCSIGQTWLGIPVSQIWMIMQGTSIEWVMAGPRCMAGKIPFYKGDIPVINPLYLLPFPAKKTLPEDSNILMIQHDKADFYGFAVDHILGVHQIEKDQFMREDLSKELSSFSAIRGRVWLEDRTIHIIDTRQLLSTETIRQCQEAMFQ